ncbi:MAG TPA: ADP-ribosylglycohydrolase [Clostridiaceae bacterium]|nr:ADP-ribosylglycohydrolase [Clostridiaceae bacterium]
MNKELLFNKIKGCLVTAGMGDAIGAPTEAMSRVEIENKYGGRITTFVDGSTNPYALGNKVAEITDDASQMYEMALQVIKCNGELTVEAAADGLLSWADKYPRYYPRNAGPTTRHVIKELRSGGDPYKIGKIGEEYDRGVSNGAVMRVAAAGLWCPGNLDAACKTAITMCIPSHNTQHAYAAASSIACGISEAIQIDSTIMSVVKACLYGAKKGMEIGEKEARQATGIDTYEAIMRAIECALRASSPEECERLLEAYIGNDGAVQVGAAVAIGLFIANDGDPKGTILSGANIGGDTDTLACIAGMLSGAFAGYSALPSEWCELFERVNKDLDFDTVSRQLTNIAAHQ